MYLHARDYLLEYANKTVTNDWLRLLINKIISTNTDITDSDKDMIYQLLKTDTSSTIPLIQATPTEELGNTIKLEKLIHHSGVCALRNEQTINFSPDLTILWGLNGSGKSSYFKILNEIVGGNVKKEIKSNIYVDSPQPINVDITYEESSRQRTLHWDNIDNRAVLPLNVIKVFDSSYLNGLLIKRPTDETVVNPYGLNIFAKLSEIIDGLKQRLQLEIEQEVLPDIDKNKLENRFRIIIDGQKYTQAQKGLITPFYNCSQATLHEIEKIKNSIEQISKTDYETKISTAFHNKEILSRIKSNIQEIYLKYKDDIHEVKELIYGYQLLKVESKNVKASTNILATIGDTDSDTWKNFIKAGDTYMNEAHLDGNRCPYCRQPLNQNALGLIQAYSTFLNDKSEKDLSVINAKVDKKIRDLQYDRSNFTSEKSNLNILDEEQTSLDLLFEKIKILDCFFNSQRHILAEYLSSRDFVSTFFDDISILPDFDTLIYKYEQCITQYTATNKEKEVEIQKLAEKLFPFEQNKYISENRQNFDEWFTKIEKINKLKLIHRGVSTRSITELSDKAYNELITDNLKNEFNSQLQNIGLNRLSVELQSAGKSKKGVVSMIIKLNTNDIIGILSEGELKGVGLALFIAEAKLQDPCNPIIFDDPVNSLDHRIAANFANMLMTLNNQVVIFTHHTLFLDAFECSRDHHFCKILNGTCQKDRGKHIYLFQVQSEGKSDKGIIISKDQNAAIAFIKKAKDRLNRLTFTETKETAIDLRNAIERIIDEKIFYNQVPTKYSNKKSRINWDALKNLNNDSTIIDKLNQYHSRLSGGDLHNGTEALENPIEKEEFLEMVGYLENLMQ